MLNIQHPSYIKHKLKFSFDHKKIALTSMYLKYMSTQVLSSWKLICACMIFLNVMLVQHSILDGPWYSLYAGFNGFNEVEIFSNKYWSMDQKDFLKLIIERYRQNS